jgi:hypothetical protein
LILEEGFWVRLCRSMRPLSRLPLAINRGTPSRKARSKGAALSVLA